MTARPSPEARAQITGLDREQLVAMGEVAYWEARVERTLSLVVTALISTDDEKGVAVTRGLGFGRLLDLGAQLVDLRPKDDEARDTYTRLSGELRRVMESRNRLMHGDWTRPRQGPASASSPRAKRTEDGTFTVDQVEDVAIDLAVLSNGLFILFLVIEGRVD